MNVEIFWAIVPWLAILVCPLMMLFMMWGMPGGACHKRPAELEMRGRAVGVDRK